MTTSLQNTTFMTPTMEASLMTELPKLLPFQARTLVALEHELTHNACVALAGRAGTGKTVIAETLARAHGGRHLTLADYAALADQAPYDKWGARVFASIHDALDRHAMLIVDDYSYAMMGYIDYQQAREERARLADRAEREGRKLIFVGRTTEPEHEARIQGNDDARSMRFYYETDAHPLLLLPPFMAVEDLTAFAEALLGKQFVAGVDFEAVHLHAAALTPRLVRLVCALLEKVGGPVTTAGFIETISRYVLHDSVNLHEVEQVSFADLPGTQRIAQALEAHVVLPFQHPEAALQFGAKARRGVMLFGPPGTGKTSIGRALAHRMKGKFFLIDGSIPTEPPHIFIARVNAIIDRAIVNAPSVLFIDDADNLFSIPYVQGVVRKLLSLLDGLETKSASQVCVMMTVMDPVHVPDALLRSGRVELWLETQAPNAPTRAAMFARWQAQELPDHDAIDYDALAAASPGFTPADIRRVMADARLFLAQDRKSGRPDRSGTEYAMQAIEAVIAMRSGMAEVLMDDSLNMGGRSMMEAGV
jgi:transitional endoplasmic reticulum ATPase